MQINVAVKAGYIERSVAFPHFDVRLHGCGYIKMNKHSRVPSKIYHKEMLRIFAYHGDLISVLFHTDLCFLGKFFRLATARCMQNLFDDMNDNLISRTGFEARSSILVFHGNLRTTGGRESFIEATGLHIQSNRDGCAAY